MKHYYITKIFLIMLVCLVSFQGIVYGSLFEFSAYMSNDFKDSESAKSATWLAVNTFQKLGYINYLMPNNYSITAQKSNVIDYIRISGNNFGIYLNAHGNQDVLTMNSSDANQEIYPQDISGYWHLVFLDSCSTLKTDKFGYAFQTIGYNKRSILGWYDDVTIRGSHEWWSNFYNIAGTTNIRSACLAAADASGNYTPIRIYGDKTWTGRAF